MNTKQHITSLKNFFPNINSILEIQCGAAYGIENCQALQDKNLQYIGVDVLEETIYDNRQYFRNEKNKIFMTLDASNEPLPKADLIVCTAMAPYLPISNIWALLENIRDSEARYFAFNYDSGNADEINSELNFDGENSKESSLAKRRPINLSNAPFYFPKPKFLIPTEEPNQFVAFYEIRDVSFFMDWHNDDVSQMRMKLFNRIHEDFAVLEPSFAKEINGKEMFEEMMLQFLEIAPSDHNQKYYYDQPYQDIVNRVSGLINRNNIFRLVYRSETDILNKEKGYEFLDNENSIHAQILAKDFIRWKFGLPLWID